MRIALGLAASALSATIEKRVFKRPRLPILPEENLELRQHKKWVFDHEKIVEIEERIINNPDVLKFENHEDYYLLHQTDFITVYDRLRDVPYKTFAKISPTEDPSRAFRFHEKSMDPRSLVWNDYRTPFFSAALGSSAATSSEAFISSNMFDADHLGWEAFCEKVLFYLTEDAGEVGLIMTNNKNSIDIELSFQDGIRGGKQQLTVEKEMLKSKAFRENPRDFMIKNMSKETVYLPLVRLLKKADSRKGSVRYPTWKPKAYLCRNAGQYDPWWSHSDYYWNRCSTDKYPPEGDQLVYACQCDRGCQERKDCCTVSGLDYLHSCLWKDVDGAHKPWAYYPNVCDTTDGVCPTGDPVTLLISMDGFRYSYIEERGEMLPNILHMRKCGLKTHMQCSYPSKTFPNHYTLATGLHPSQHGIVDNDWFDWKRNASCSVFNDYSQGDYPCNVNDQDEGWYGGDPIWNTVERHGKISGTCLWPGNELLINGQKPTYVWDYDTYGDQPFADRIYQILDWIQRPVWDGNETTKAESRPDFMTLYFNEPDHSGHGFGPYDESGELNRALKRVDTMIGMLMDGLRVYGMNSNCLNIVMTSDHGMEQTLCKDKVESVPPAEDLLSQLYIKTKTTHQVIGAAKSTSENIPVWGSDFQIGEAIDRFACQYDEMHMRTFDKYLMPKRLHYSDTTRIESVHNLMRIGMSTLKYMPSNCQDEGHNKATHGWDNKYDAMHVPLTLYGPDFNHNANAEVIGSVQNIEIYKLILDLVGIEPDSDQLNTTVMPTQFSEFGKFTPLMKYPEEHHQPESSQTASHRPDIPSEWSEADFTIQDDLIMDSRLNAPIYMSKKHLKKEMSQVFGSLELPFWWNSMIDTFEQLELDNNFAGDFDIQAGLAYDVSGLGVFVDPNDFVNGRVGYEGKPGCCRLKNCVEEWCKTKDGQPIPTHFYLIMRLDESKSFNVLLPWRSDQQEKAGCRVANEEECRLTYAGDFNCFKNGPGQIDLSQKWWSDQMDEHSAKVIEIEKLTGLKEYFAEISKAFDLFA